MVIQFGYARQMLIIFWYAKCNVVIIPMHLGLKLKLDMEALVINIFFYQHLVGKLMFLTQTQPYISFAINMFSSFFH
jgi:hypothetical protein